MLENCAEFRIVYLCISCRRDIGISCKTENNKGLMRSDAICLSDAPGLLAN